MKYINALFLMLLLLGVMSSSNADTETLHLKIYFDTSNPIAIEIGRTLIDRFRDFGIILNWEFKQFADILIDSMYYPGIDHFLKYLEKLMNDTSSFQKTTSWEDFYDVYDIWSQEISEQSVSSLPLIFQPDIVYGVNQKENYNDIIELLLDANDLTIYDRKINTELQNRDALQLNVNDLGALGLLFTPLGYIDNYGSTIGIGAKSWNMNVTSNREIHEFTLRPMKFGSSNITVKNYYFSIQVMKLNSVQTNRSSIYNLINEFEIDEERNLLRITTNNLTLEERLSLTQITPTPLELNTSLTYLINNVEFKFPVLSDVRNPMESLEWIDYGNGKYSLGLYKITGLQNKTMILEENGSFADDKLGIIFDGLLKRDEYSIILPERLSSKELIQANSADIGSFFESVSGIKLLSGKWQYLLKEVYPSIYRGTIYFITGNHNITSLAQSLNFDIATEINELLINQLTPTQSWLPIIINVTRPDPNIQELIFTPLVSSINHVVSKNYEEITFSRVSWSQTMIGMILVVVLYKKQIGRNLNQEL